MSPPASHRAAFFTRDFDCVVQPSSRGAKERGDENHMVKSGAKKDDIHERHIRILVTTKGFLLLTLSSPSVGVNIHHFSDGNRRIKNFFVRKKRRKNKDGRNPLLSKKLPSQQHGSEWQPYPQNQTMHQTLMCELQTEKRRNQQREIVQHRHPRCHAKVYETKPLTILRPNPRWAESMRNP